MPRYKILTLDGGGAWALIEVMALIDLYGADTTGHQVLSKFDMVAANSGGSIVLGGLVENLTLQNMLDFFLSQDKRQSVFVKKSLHLPGMEKYITTEKLSGLRAAFAAMFLSTKSRRTFPAIRGYRSICLSPDSTTTATAANSSVPRQLPVRAGETEPHRQPRWPSASTPPATRPFVTSTGRPSSPPNPVHTTGTAPSAGPITPSSSPSPKLWFSVSLR